MNACQRLTAPDIARMGKAMLTLLCIAAVAGVIPARAQEEPALIPRPATLVMDEGRCVVAPGSVVATPAGLSSVAGTILGAAAGFALTPAGEGATALIRFSDAAGVPAGMTVPAGEGYVLSVRPEGVAIHAATIDGHRNGMQTLAQLLRTAPGSNRRELPCLRIADAPRFAWRGYLLDESRHFTGPEAVLRIIDAMAAFKLNRLHWHLTDSSGWRIEIKAFPKLTEIGSRGSETDRRADAPRQFYTRDEVRRIVTHARERGITVIPAIEMPGHADAAVLAYPEHDGGGFPQKGSRDKWPRFTFNPAKPATLAFLDAILKEVAGLFPDAGVIHFGGDEVHFGWKHWPELPEVQELMRKEGLKDLVGVETWFNRRMAATINGLGFKTGGWDEIIARDLPADRTVVFWWRHDKPALLRQALAAGYPVVLCPRRPCYFDFVQDDAHKVGRRWAGFNPLADVYAFPQGLSLTSADEAKVLGVQACLWTEDMATQARRDFMTWPRLVALAEAAWTPATRKDWLDFQRRLPPHIADLTARGFRVHPLACGPEVTK